MLANQLNNGFGANADNDTSILDGASAADHAITNDHSMDMSQIILPPADTSVVNNEYEAQYN